MLVKIHKSYRDIIAICDSNLLGKKFEQAEAILDITDFYKGNEVNEQKLLEIMKNYSIEDATFNIVGEKSIQTALEAGIITEQGVKKVQNIPFALVLL